MANPAWALYQIKFLLCHSITILYWWVALFLGTTLFLGVFFRIFFYFLQHSLWNQLVVKWRLVWVVWLLVWVEVVIIVCLFIFAIFDFYWWIMLLFVLILLWIWLVGRLANVLAVWTRCSITIGLAAGFGCTSIGSRPFFGVLILLCNLMGLMVVYPHFPLGSIRV